MNKALHILLAFNLALNCLVHPVFAVSGHNKWGAVIMVRKLDKKKQDPEQKINVRRRPEEITKGFNATGFFLGLILNVYGLIGVYLFSKDKNMIRWAWRGFLVLVLAVFVIGGILAFASLPG